MFFLIAALSAFLLWIVFNSFFLPSLPKTFTLPNSPLVSVLIPMRNEERNVETLTSALKAAVYPNLEFIILNDQSTDRTGVLLEQMTAGDSRFTVIGGKELPPDWVGKVHACHQLQQHAKGDYLLFIDADIRFSPEAIGQALALMNERQAKLLSGFPAFDVPPFLSKLLVPMQHFVVLFHLPLVLANYANFPAATAANGMWMMFERKSYDAVGGHAAVRNSLVEDVHIARRFKASGHKMLLANITKSVQCRMYDTNHDVWEGFLKNSYTGIGRSPVFAVALALFYSFFYILPLFLALYGISTNKLLFTVPYVLAVVQQAYVMARTRQHLYLALLIPLQAAAMIAVLLQSMWKSWRKKPYTWKGRQYS
ncbi:Glycosyltransferase, catalytic subunit of cellulose synthase and poly-beta-1,6-N-acetylglucosamine synthase [Planococcus glaciei]|uniref:glycosyltransferase n=1 Tax=Planococcus glaciei TaxID=459472 RepID=UPI00088F0D40|nr:glycosyltransferase [Planococcus glaciei]SDG70646.1 Glycosyltransferase, catalytic subunit of cellulose synthase and poly-beta-1,6-N-acetylglucosamine synthase [Planococcus glaciei]